LILTVSSLGAQSLRHSRVGIGEAGDLLLSLLDNDEVKSLDVGTNDASTDGLPSSLSGSALAVARVALAEEQADTSGQQDTCE
jgi:hypothetical protein